MQKGPETETLVQGAGALVFSLFLAVSMGWPSRMPVFWLICLVPGAIGLVAVCWRTFWYVVPGAGQVFKSQVVRTGERLVADGVKRVELSKAERMVGRGKSRRLTEVFPVLLLPAAVEVDAGVDEGKARQLAEALARGLGVPLRDSTGMEERDIPAHLLDENLRDRMVREDEQPVMPDGDPPARCRRARQGQDLVLDFAPCGYNNLNLGCGGFCLALTCLLIFGLSPRLAYSGTAGLFLWGFFGVAVLATVLWVVLDATTQQRVRISPTRLHVSTWSQVHRLEREIPVRELEGLDVVTRPRSTGRPFAVRARSDRQVVHFAASAALDEAHWVRDSLRAALLG